MYIVYALYGVPANLHQLACVMSCMYIVPNMFRASHKEDKGILCWNTRNLRLIITPPPDTQMNTKDPCEVTSNIPHVSMSGACFPLSAKLSEECSPSVCSPPKTTQPSTLSVDCTKDVNWWCHDLKPSLLRDWMKTSAHPSVNAPALQSCFFIYWFVFSCGWRLRCPLRVFAHSGVFNPPLSPFSPVAPTCEEPPWTESTTLHVLTLKLHLAWWQTFKGL